MKILTDIVNIVNQRLLMLRPGIRALVAFACLTVVATAVWLALFGVTLMAAVWGAWLAMLVIYFGFRIGYFSPRALVQLPSDAKPYPHRIRKTPGNFQMKDWDDAQYVDVEDALDQLQPDERVIGIELDRTAVAYPLRTMVLREVANEEIAGTPISVTWSPLTYSARAFIALDPEGNPLTLAPTGTTMFNSPLLESENGTQYLQFTGEALIGTDAGHQLQHLPCINTTWSAWQQAWPETEAMSVEGMPERDIFESYYATDRAGLFQQPAKDKTLPNKDIVIGIIGCGDNGATGSVVYSAHLLRENPLLNESLAGAELLVLCERGSATYCVFDRKVKPNNGASDERVLTFESQADNEFRPNRVVAREGQEDDDEGGTPDAEYEPWTLRDLQTGSLWSAITGTCIEGELRGTKLRMIPARNGFWFAWSKIHSDVPLATGTEVGSDG